MSPKTLAALERVKNGATRADAAAAEGVCASAVYRAARMAGLPKPARAPRQTRGLSADEIRAAKKRGWAKRAVIKAELPLMRRIVDRARLLLDDGSTVRDAVRVLQREFRRVDA